jgi:hypothetical protein
MSYNGPATAAANALNAEKIFEAMKSDALAKDALKERTKRKNKVARSKKMPTPNLEPVWAGDESACTTAPTPPVPTPEDDEPVAVPKMWAVYGNTYTPCEKAIKSLRSGHYDIKVSSSQGIYFEDKVMNTDDIITLSDSASEEIVNGIEHFWSKKDKYRALKLLWKRGILLYGPPGGGKTSTVHLITRSMVERKGLAIYVSDPNLAIAGLDTLRYIEPDRPIIVILEDIDAIISRHGEPAMLSLLDGQAQIDNVVYLATTNYPEKLDKRITNRPSRFDIVKQVPMPSPEARTQYLSAKLPELAAQPSVLNKWVNGTEGFSIAHIKELITSVWCLELDFDETLARLRNMINNSPSSTMDNKDGNKSTGFGFMAGMVAQGK